MSGDDVDIKNFAVPAALDLESQRRPAIPGYRREVIHNTTTQNEYKPGNICYIPYDSGSAGAFCDPSCVRLEGTIEVRNKNFYCDGFNLPRCGWHALIQEFGIEIGGVLHEMNRHYAECIELDMIKRGENRTPYHLIRENPYELGGGGVGKLHINFVKPSMVTAMGLPHGVKYAPLTTATSDTYPDTISQGYLLQSNPLVYESWGRNSTSQLEKSTTSGDGSWWKSGDEVNPVSGVYSAAANGYFKTSNLSSSSFYEDQMSHYLNCHVTKKAMRSPQEGYYNTTNVNNGNTKFETFAVDNYYSVAETGTSLGPDVTMTKENAYFGNFPAGGTLLSKYSRMQGFTSTTSFMFNLTPGQATDSFSPGMWPVGQPCDYEKLQKGLKEDWNLISAHNVVDYYANCQNVPCAIPVDVSAADNGSSAIWGNSVHTKPTFDNTGGYFSTFFTFSLKLYSSLIGELAKVWFPELLVPQQKMRIRLRFQEANVLFQTVMDPCRRVPGTSRDWYPNLGIMSSDGQPVSNMIRVTRPRFILSGIHPIMVSDYVPGHCMIDAIALGKYPVPQMKMKGMHAVNKLFDMKDESSGLVPSGTTLTNINYGSHAQADDSEFPIAHPFAVVTNVGNTPAGDIYTDGLFKRLTVFFMENTPVSGWDGDDIRHLMNYTSLPHSLWRKLFYEIEQNQEYGFPLYPIAPGSATSLTDDPKPNVIPGNPNLSGIKPGTIVEMQQYIHPSNLRNYFHNSALPNNTNGDTAAIATQYDAAAATSSIFRANPYFDWKYKSLNWDPFCAPTPQYLPCKNPSDKTLARVLSTADFVSEDELCFGTHYPRAKMQVRRTHTSLYPLQVPDIITSKIDERLTYVVKNIQLVTQQIVLPRTAGLSIISNALSGGLVSEATAWTEIETTLPESTSQKVLVNAAMAFCNSISFIFQPTETIQGDQAYGYRFGSFVNPFTAFDYISESVADVPQGSSAYNDLGGKSVSYYNEINLSERVPFDIQLQLSSELLPRTPMSRISRFLTYNRWGDGVFNDMDYAGLAPTIQPSYSSTNDMTVNTLQDGFWACHIPIRCLDDQTITSNPYFAGAEISLNSVLRGARGRVQPLPITVPYVGTFHITFNLETFMGLRNRMRTGMPVVNNNLFLKFERAHLCRLFSTRMIAVLEGDGKWIYERGGMVIFIK